MTKVFLGLSGMLCAALVFSACADGDGTAGVSADAGLAGEGGEGGAVADMGTGGEGGAVEDMGTGGEGGTVTDMGTSGEGGAVEDMGTGGAGGAIEDMGIGGEGGAVADMGTGGAGGDECQPAEEVCDGLDNDCDGEIDDGFELGVACTAGVGACAATGRTICDGAGTTCDAVPGAPVDEICDALDNDCDGEVDDGLGLGGGCEANGQGACSVGVVGCDADGITCVQALPQAEVCDGVDNDCDGQVDDGLGLGGGCEANGQGACSVGVVGCDADGITCVQALPQAEVCDGVDNDCDGEVDDGLGLGGGCEANGQGACAVGVVACDADGILCVEALPSMEICDNGVDDDCDGGTDCDDADCADDEACQVAPTQVALCGPSARDLSLIFLAEDSVELISTCAPGPEVVAMFVSRGGVVNAPVFQAFLAGGGRLVSEFNKSAEIYNAVFGTAVEALNRVGSCHDNVNPSVRFSPEDSFWQTVGALPLQASEETGCGYDVSGFPNITALGGVGDDSVTLAYVDVGLGRFYLAEGDWQDNTNGVEFFNAQTRTIMRAMALLDIRPVDGAARLTDGEQAGHGRVEVFLNDEWGTVCDDAWSVENAEVVCQQMGYRGATEAISRFGGGVDPIWLDNVSCEGDEARLVDCPSPNEVGVHNCVHDEDAGARCITASGECRTDAHCEGADMCIDGACAPVPAMFAGVRTDLTVAEVEAEGFVPCHDDLYSAVIDDVGMIARCSGGEVLVTCRPVGANVFTVAAAGIGDRVFAPVPVDLTSAHEHNGVQWYYTAEYSFGFAPIGALLTRNECDTNASGQDQKLCWHTNNSGGYRCGATMGLNSSEAWARTVYSRARLPVAP